VPLEMPVPPEPESPPPSPGREEPPLEANDIGRMEPPKMAILFKDGSGKTMAVSGGVPDYFWTKLVKGNRYHHHNQYRCIDVSKTVGKSLAHNNIKPPTVLYGKEMRNRETFLTTFEDKLVENGLWHMAFMADPDGSREMKNFVRYPDLFTGDMGHARTQADRMKRRYDSYDEESSRCAKTALLESLEPNFAAQFNTMSQMEDPFPLTFLKIMNSLPTMTGSEIDKLIFKLTGMDINSYPRKDVSAANRDYDRVYQKLKSVGQYHPKYCRNYIRSFCKCIAEEDQGEWWDLIKVEVLTPLDRIVQKNNLSTTVTGDMLEADMEVRGLDIPHILLKVDDMYKRLLHNDKWPAAKTKGFDNKTPRGFVATDEDKSTSVTGLSEAQFNALVQSMGQTKGPASGKPIICHICKKHGHKSYECPDKGKVPKTTSSKDVDWSWLKEAPKSGESQTKTRDGVTRYWCGKCGRWTLSHATDACQGKPKSRFNPKQQRGKRGPRSNANVGLVAEPETEGAAWCAMEEHTIAAPSAWCARVESGPMFWVNLLLPFLLSLLLIPMTASLSRIQTLLSEVNWLELYAKLLGGLSELGRIVTYITFQVIPDYTWVVAPTIWILLLLGTVMHGHNSRIAAGQAQLDAVLEAAEAEAAFYKKPRKDRRARDHYNQSVAKARRKGASILDYNHHKSYPRRLRSTGTFYKKPFTAQERAALTVMHEIDECFELVRVRTLSRPGRFLARGRDSKSCTE